MSFRWVLIAVFVLGSCARGEAQSPFVAHVTEFRALVRDFDETSGGYSPAWSPDGRQIAYLAASDHSLWLAVLDMHNPSRPARHVRLSPRNPRSQPRWVPRWFREMRHIDWSPDGSRIAFVGSDNGLWLADGDLSATPPRVRFTLLVPAEESRLPRLFTPRWSPDGKRIAFLKHPIGSRVTSLWLLNVSPRQVRQIFPDFVADEPVWAPNGRWLACTVREREEGQPPRWDIWRISAEGEDPLPLTREGMCSMPRWSPDGKRLVFVCTTPRPTDQEGDTFKFALYGEFGRSPVAAVSVRTDNGVEFHVPALHVINADGTQRAPLTATSVRASAPVSEMFQRLNVSTSERSDVSMLYTKAVREVHFDTEPAWSANGRHLAFVRVNFAAQRGVERRCVWTVDVDTQQAEPLTVGGGEFAPAWSPRGSLLLLMTKRLLALGERGEDDNNMGEHPSESPRPRIERLESLPEIWLMVWGNEESPQAAGGGQN